MPKEGGHSPTKNTSSKHMTRGSLSRTGKRGGDRVNPSDDPDDDSFKSGRFMAGGMAHAQNELLSSLALPMQELIFP